MFAMRHAQTFKLGEISELDREALRLTVLIRIYFNGKEFSIHRDNDHVYYTSNGLLVARSTVSFGIMQIVSGKSCMQTA